jgi:hypothetical protein
VGDRVGGRLVGGSVGDGVAPIDPEHEYVKQLYVPIPLVVEHWYEGHQAWTSEQVSYRELHCPRTIDTDEKSR